MVKLINNGVFLADGLTLIEDNNANTAEMLNKAGISADKAAARRGTMAYQILYSHNKSGSPDKLSIKFDAMASHDITYVGIIQTAKASGLDHFPMPYVLTNCHNSLCAVGGTINEDDHVFGLSAAKRYGGIYVPAHGAVIHQYMREEFTACGSMILGSDSHTRYGALGTMGIGEGGPELVKQLLGKTYDIAPPDVIAVYLTGAPRPGVGPQDVALAVISTVFKNGFVKNKVLEFVGDGIANLSADYRIGIDVMTTETACLSSIWRTDDEVIKEYYEIHGRSEDYKPLAPQRAAYYDGAVIVDLGKVEPMIAMPFHPSNAYTIAQLCADPGDVLRKVERDAKEHEGIEISLCDKIVNGKVRVAQGSISGCAGGTFENLCAAADILSGRSLGDGEFVLSVYPASQPVYSELIKNGRLSSLIDAGVVAKTAFCGPCFGAGDVPYNNALSIRHTTRNFPNREGSKPGEGQMAYVALMDARSIAATAANKGYITAATDLDIDYSSPRYHYNNAYYKNRVYMGYDKADSGEQLKYGPYIADWPEMSALTDNLLLKVASVITDAVTTTDELIPSGEISSYRSNPLRFSEFALSRKDPGYVGRAKQIQQFEKLRREGKSPQAGELEDIFTRIRTIEGFFGIDPAKTGIGSVIFARKPGDGSAREQAASCQRVLGGWANIANEYATKRYRSNLINWGMIPFITQLKPQDFNVGDYIFITDAKNKIMSGEDTTAYIINGNDVRQISLSVGDLTDEERKIILAGSLINHYRG